MKKILLSLIVVSAFAATSCKKDYVCTCTDSSTQPGYQTTTYDVTIKEARKMDAANACVKRTTTIGGFTYTDDCKLK
ncbi:MAG: hypothetical protein MUF75_02890 [Bacteroidia bacterium]|jgi:hypothetical protein|nr:hypothetical protein [Bacteroidia bacterium]